MTQTPDATLLATLEEQYRELDYALTRLQCARVALVPAAATFWRGAARLAFDSALAGLTTTLDSAAAAVASARVHTDQAMSQVVPVA